MFTGGECFLLGDALFHLIAHSKKNGFVTRCVTNGYWATSKNVEKVVDALVDAGLDEVNFSTGEEHGSYVPIERVRDGAVACDSRGIQTLINIELFNETTFATVSFLEDPTLYPAVESGRIKVQRNVWIRGDGKRGLTHRPAHSRFSPERIGGCHTALSVIAVTPKQSLVACCGLHMERIPELHLGSVKEKTLREVISVAPNDFLKIWIHVEGPERILQFVKSKVPNYVLPIDSVHPCTTCLHLYRDEIARSVILQNYFEVEEHISSLFLAGLAKGEVGRQMAETTFGDT